MNMTIEEFLMSDPSREEIAVQICAVANNYYGFGVDIDDTFVWKWLSEAGEFKKDDFYDDQEDTLRRYNNDMEAITNHGVRTWKLKDGVL